MGYKHRKKSNFWESHLVEKRGQYSHDNFVTNNMSEAGYQKMCEVLRAYLSKFEYQDLNTKKITKKDSLTLSFKF